MTSFSQEVESLTGLGLLPTVNVSPFKNTDEFWMGLAKPIYLPIGNSLAACYYAINAIWSALCVVGNLAICKPIAANVVLSDLGVQLSLGVGMAIMAPINLLCSAIELVLKIASSWLVGKEIEDDLSKKDWFQKFASEAKELDHLLPSSKYVKNRFFKSYNDLGDFLGGAFYTIGAPFETGFCSLHQALKTIQNALNCVANVIIDRPLHAQECLSHTSMHLSLSISLAIMTPINAIVQGIEVLSRLGTTWMSKCMEGEGEPSRPSFQ